MNLQNFQVFKFLTRYHPFSMYVESKKCVLFGTFYVHTERMIPIIYFVTVQERQPKVAYSISVSNPQIILSCDTQTEIKAVQP